MVKTFGEAADFTAFKVVDGDIYRIAWAKTMQVEKTEDGEEKESSLCDYMLERYDYRPSMDLVLNDILASGEQASMQEIKEICEGLEVEPLEYMKRALLAYIGDYDNSPAVNAFILNGNLVSWSSDDPKSPNKSVRMGLRQNISDKQTKGEENITMWLGGMPITLKCEEAETLMCNLEDYAYECFNVTAAHKKTVSELETVEEVLTYDYKQGYPSKLEIKI